jgi:hypothetical protein
MFHGARPTDLPLDRSDSGVRWRLYSGNARVGQLGAGVVEVGADRSQIGGMQRDRLWVVEVIAPFGGAEEMVKDLKAKAFANDPLRFLATGAAGKEVRTL